MKRRSASLVIRELQIKTTRYHLLKVKMLSHVQLFETPWTVACQAPLSMGFPRQEYWSGLPFPPPGDLLRDQSDVSRIASRHFTIWATREAHHLQEWYNKFYKNNREGFPGGSVVKNLPENAEDMCSIPNPGRSDMLQGIKPMCHNYWACGMGPGKCNCIHMPQVLKLSSSTAHALQWKQPLQREACAPQLENSPHTVHLEKSLCSNKDTKQPKIINKVI